VSGILKVLVGSLGTFESEYSGDRRAVKGTGLGFAISKTIMEAYGG